MVGFVGGDDGGQDGRTDGGRIVGEEVHGTAIAALQCSAKRPARYHRSYGSVVLTLFHGAICDIGCRVQPKEMHHGRRADIALYRHPEPEGCRG
jgi:hypothetical protein